MLRSPSMALCICGEGKHTFFSKCCRGPEEEVIIKKVNLNWDDQDCPAGRVQEEHSRPVQILKNTRRLGEWLCSVGGKKIILVCASIGGRVSSVEMTRDAAVTVDWIMVLKCFKCCAQEFGTYPAEHEC